jgi:hypothetical protein
MFPTAPAGTAVVVEQRGFASVKFADGKSKQAGEPDIL